MNSKIEELLDRAISSLRAYIVSGSEAILEDVLDSIAELKQFPLRGIYEIKLDEVQSLIADKDFWKARKELEYVSTSGHYNGYTFEDETRDAEGEEDNEPIGPDDISPELWGRDEMDFPLAEDTSLMGIRAMLDKISEEKPSGDNFTEESKDTITEKENGKYVVSGDNVSGHVFIHRIMGRGGILPWVSDIQDATIFDDLEEAKRYAAAHMLMANNVKVEPISNYHIDEAVMDHLAKHREGNGWQNEPNEQIAGWKAVVDDSQGLSKPQDMFNPVKGNDNPMTIAANKKDKELHESIITEDSEISNIQDSLTQKYGEYKKIACNDCGTYPCECEESESGKDSPFSHTDNDYVKLKENIYDGTKDLEDFATKDKNFSSDEKFDEYADGLTYPDDLDKKKFKEEVLHFLRKNGFVLSSKSLATRTIVWKSKRLGIFLSLKWEIGEWDLFGVSRSGFGKTPIREILTSDAQAVVDFLKNAIKEV